MLQLSCYCEHSHHFSEDNHGNPTVQPGHDYGAIREDARPASVQYQYGDLFCAWCLLNCHKGAHWLTADEIKEWEAERVRQHEWAMSRHLR